MSQIVVFLPCFFTTLSLFLAFTAFTSTLGLCSFRTDFLGGVIHKSKQAPTGHGFLHACFLACLLACLQPLFCVYKNMEEGVSCYVMLWLCVYKIVNKGGCYHSWVLTKSTSTVITSEKKMCINCKKRWLLLFDRSYSLTRLCRWSINQPPHFLLSKTHKNKNKHLGRIIFLPDDQFGCSGQSK